MFKHEPCSCAPEVCIKGVAPPSDCVNRLQGTVEAVRCEKCNGDTLHHNGECLRCQRLRTKSSVIAQAPANGNPKNQSVSITSSPLSLSIKLGEGSIIVTEKKQIAKVLKILLED